MTPEINVWTDERVEQLRELWMRECPQLSAQEIGRRMGLSKNQVVGKAHRLKLPGRASPIHPGKPKPKKSRADALKAPVVMLPAAKASEPERRSKPKPDAATVHSWRVSGGLRAHIARATGMDRIRPMAPALGPAPKACQFIEADKQHFTDADKCGAPTVAHSAYCAKHHRRCWRPREQAKEREAEAA